MARKRRADYDPLNKFIRATWGNLNKRTVNGSCPDTSSPGTRRYLERGIRLEFTREEFVVWCAAQRTSILSMDRPSIDRIDSTGHYRLENIRIVPLHVNMAQGRLTQRLRAEANRPLRHCLMCGTQLKIHRKEGAAKFAQRKTCGVTCLGKAMSAGLIFRGRAAVKHNREKHGQPRPTTGENPQ